MTNGHFMTGEEAAAAVGVSRRTLVRWESSAAWKAATAAKMAQAQEAERRALHAYIRGRGYSPRAWEERLAARAAARQKKKRGRI